MLSKGRIQFINSLGTSKYRRINKKFVAEGPKLVKELLQSNLTIDVIFGTREWIIKANSVLKKSNAEIVTVTENELERISSLKTPNQVIAVINIPQQSTDLPSAGNQLILALDNISDPGNAGTIIRTAEWFGVRNIVCSEDCADIYNPKVVQASMGSIFRVAIFYTNLKEYLYNLPKSTPVYGAVLNGLDIFTTELSINGVVLIGNESHGISPELLSLVNTKIRIPDFSCDTLTSAESLNASIATAIVLAEFRRRSAYR